MPFVAPVTVSKLSLTRSMVSALGAVAFGKPVRSQGWERSMVYRSVPSDDVPIQGDSYLAQINDLIDLQIPNGCRLSCRNFYPEYGGIDWHTDSSNPGWRLYVYRYRNGDGLFRYNGRRFVETGMGGYVFQVGPGCWHCLAVTGERLSCGLEMSESMAMDLLKQQSQPFP